MRYREQRFATDRELRLVHGSEVQRVQLTNVSATGARLQKLAPLPRDTRVVLCHLHHKFPAKVVWSNERQTGVTFIEPLSNADLQTLAGTVGQMSRHGGGWSNHGFRELR